MFRSNPFTFITTMGLFAAAVLLAYPQFAVAGDDPGGSPMASKHPAQTPDAASRSIVATGRVSASASAHASASSSGSTKNGECHARSEASAEARAGDEHQSDHDEAEMTSTDGECSARAQARAQANSGPRTR